MCTLTRTPLYKFYMHQINLCTNVFPPKSTYSRCVKCQIFGTFGTPNTKKPPIRCCICAKIISFMSVPLQICNGTETNAKPKYCFLFGFLSPLTFGLGFFSLFSQQTSSSLNRERTKWYTPHLQTISSKARWPLSLEEQAAWVRPLQSSPLWSCWSLSFFWWLVVLIVGGWLILVYGGRLIGLWVVGVRLGCGLWE